MTNKSNRENGGIVQTLREILETIVAAEEERQRHGKGSTTLGKTRLGYEFSIDTGTLSDLGPDSRTTNSSDRATAVRYVDGNVLVTIDIPEVDPETVSAGVDNRTGELLLGIDGTIEERIPLRQKGLKIVTASVTNGILEFHLQPIEAIKE
ncbi:gas vesicle protein GvpH [Halocatena marina]|uniref:gas vesicle protein GvpH n=1 Tax=Halocatena marina TaxID=2934937 RepID=UPI00200F44F7|nr:gas vesicle protein GvpH [Halocatena marina]